MLIMCIRKGNVTRMLANCLGALCNLNKVFFQIGLLINWIRKNSLNSV